MLELCKICEMDTSIGYSGNSTDFINYHIVLMTGANEMAGGYVLKITGI